MKTFLNVGAGYTPITHNPYSEIFFGPGKGWYEIRVDIDPKTKPDIIADITDLNNIRDECVDAVFSSHTLEHIYTCQVPMALAEFYRVIKPGGYVAFYLPDMAKVAQQVLDGKLDDILYTCDAGPIRTVDIIFGMEGAIYECPPMMHKTAFTPATITKKLEEAGFKNVSITEDLYDIWVMAER
jgi:ubiquinone/menaquinone biosynthesis C-methylase UbiE